MSQSLMMVLGGLTGFMAFVLLVLAIRNHRRNLVVDDVLPSPTALPSFPEDARGGRLRHIGAVLRPKDKKAIDELKNRVTQAGLYSRDAVDLFLSIRLTLMVVGLVISLLAASALEEPPVAVLFFLFVMGTALVGPGIWLSARTKERQLAILRSLPTTVDLLVTCLDAGLNLEQAMERVSDQSRFSDDVLAQEIRMTVAEMRAGIETAAAYRKMAARIGLEDINTLTVVITQASTLGTNIGNLLREHARTMRQHRMLQLEEQAGKANAKLTLPLTLCLLPAVLVLLLGPAVIMMLKSL